MPESPLKLFQLNFCKNCPAKCNASETQFQNCVLAAILAQMSYEFRFKKEKSY
jgi:hypothetical protein